MSRETEKEFTPSEEFDNIYEKLRNSIKEVRRIFKRAETTEKIQAFENINRTLIQNFNFLNQNLVKTIKELKGHGSGFQLYSDMQQKYQEIEILKKSYDETQNITNKADISLKIAKIYTGMEDWGESIAILEQIIKYQSHEVVLDEISGRLFRELGISKTQLHKDSYIQYAEGRNQLEQAIKFNQKDYDAISSLGSTWKYIDNKKALEYYLKALKLAPYNSYPLINVIFLEIALRGKIKPIKKYKKNIEKAIIIRSEQIEQSKDIPWAYFDLGTLYLFLGDVKMSIRNYLLAIRDSPDIWPINTTLNTIDLARDLHPQINGIEKVRILLLLGMGFFLKKLGRTKSEIWKKLINELSNYQLVIEKPVLKDPIILFVGGINNIDNVELKNYAENFRAVFEDYKCVILCGCLNDKINDLIQSFNDTSLNLDAYIYDPNRTNLNQIREKIVYRITERDFNTNFDIIFQYWFDILNSQTEFEDIRMVGIDGMEIALFEYQIAIAFGIPLGIMKPLKDATSDLFQDSQWKRIIEEKYVKKPYFLYKDLENSVFEISNFIKKLFIRDPDIDNLQLLFIQNLEDGGVIFDIDFIQEKSDIDKRSALLNVLDKWGEVEFKAGKAISIDFENKYLLGDFIWDRNFKIIFFLKEKPSDWLKKKITLFIKEIEKKLGAEAVHDAKIGKVLQLNTKMSRIILEVFGEDALNLAKSWQKLKVQMKESFLNKN